METRNKTNDATQGANYPTTPRSKVIETILADQQIRLIIRRVAKRNKTPLFMVQRRARKILKKMTANLTPGAIRLSYRFFTSLWKKIYDRLYVDLKGLERIKPVLKEHPVVLIPSHKSHFDYLLLSSVFHEHSLVPPYIAAGVNLAFWPLGYIFRKTGAFFIRRTIGSDILYYKLLFAYMSSIIKEKGTQEFFIEGGRSRNGKLQYPKIGLLTLQIDTFLEEEEVEDLYFVPISIAYDRILEENAYYSEITGKEKRKESIWELVRSLRVLKSQYGNAFINFSEPISFKDYMSEKIGTDKLTAKLKKKVIKDLSLKIVKDINKRTPVTPTALIALSLLSTIEKKMSQKDIMDIAKLFLSFLKAMGTDISEPLRADERSILTGIKFLVDAGLIRSIKKDNTKIYEFKTSQRIPLDYYKNNIIHYCVPLLFISASIAKEKEKKISLERLFKDIDFLSKLFALEFFIHDDFSAEIDKALKWMVSERIITVEGEQNKTVLVKDEQNIGLFSRSLKKYIASYYMTALGVKRIMNGQIQIREEKIETLIIKVGIKMLRTKEIKAREAVTVPCITNALKYINRNAVPSLRGMQPNEYLEEEEDLIIHEADHDPESESKEQNAINALVDTLKEFLKS